MLERPTYSFLQIGDKVGVIYSRAGYKADVVNVTKTQIVVKTSNGEELRFNRTHGGVVGRLTGWDADNPELVTERVAFERAKFVRDQRRAHQIKLVKGHFREGCDLPAELRKMADEIEAQEQKP